MKAREGRRRVAVTAIALVSAACGAGWRRIEPVAVRDLAPRQQVQVWTGDRKLRWHGVELAGDTLWGVRYDRPPECDSCRAAVLWSDVDSVRVGDPELAFFASVGAVLAGAVAYLIIVGTGDY